MKEKTAEELYGDIMYLPYRQSVRHARMSMKDRAAQFAPFAALTGYEEQVAETGRITGSRIELTEDQKSVIDGKIRILDEKRDSSPAVTVIYYVPDPLKEGGEYRSVTDSLRKADDYSRCLIMEHGTVVPVDDIFDIRGEVFEKADY